MGYLFLVRHSIAESVAEGGDHLRKLSQAGRVRGQALASFLAEYMGEPNEIWFSPALRTQETAELIVSELRLHQITTTCLSEKELGLSGSFDILCQKIIDYFAENQSLGRHLLLVGHFPVLQRLLSSLLLQGGHAFNPIWEPGAVACLVPHAHLRDVFQLYALIQPDFYKKGI
jgi:phosphohistidine phosphatase SixA